MKSNMFKIFAIFVILSMALTSVTSVTAAAPAVKEGPNTKYELVEASSEVIGEIEGATEPARYIIILADKPLATYAGGIDGLAATTPSKTGGKLDVTSAASAAYLDYLKAQQAAFLTDVKATLGRSPEVLFQYRLATNGFSMILTPAEAAALSARDGVRVFRAPVETPDTDTGPQLIGAPAIWDGETADTTATKGEDIIVGIIDTGVNFDHPSFAETTPADPYIYPAAAKYFGVCDPANVDQYDADYATACNDKLIGAFTYVKDDPDESQSPEDSEGHGSHTASTVAGNKVDVEYQGVATTISGVAPHARIISFDVCVPTPPNGACYGDATVAAVDDALATGVNVINYSISGGSNPYGDPVELAFLAATEAGIFVSTSAGNAGDTTGYSAVAHRSPWVATVAAATHSRIFASEIDVTGPGTVDPALIGMGAVPSGAPLTATITDKPIKYSTTNLNGCAAFAPGFFTGSVALIQRGTCNFTVKTANAYAAGADYVIIFNSRSGPPVGMPVPETSSMLSLEDGLAVKAWIDANPTATVTIHAEVAKVVNPLWEDIVAAFSSLGPNTTFDVLKPDITGPGVNILAAVADDTIAPSGEYELELYQGTSMSSPHNAGAAALVMNLHPACTPAEIKSAMMLTAADGLRSHRSALGEGVRAANPQDEGSGRIALELTGLTGLVMSETIANYEAADPDLGGDPSALNMASLYDSQCVGECSWERTFTSVADVPATYTAAAPAWITVDPATFAINPGASQVVTFTANVGTFDADVWQYGKVEFTTEDSHPLVGTTQLSEDFEGGDIPAGWNMVAEDPLSPFMVDDGSDPANDNGVVPHTGDYRAWHDDYDVAQDGDVLDPVTSWLITPAIAIPATGTTALTFWQENAYMAYAFPKGHTLQVSTGSCVPADGAFTELVDLTVAPSLSAWTLRTIDLSAYAGQTICLAWKYYGDYASEWFIDDIEVANTPAGDGPAISDVHLPVAVLPTASNLPGLVTFETNRDAGGGTISDLFAMDIPALTVDTYGFVKGEPHQISLPVDPTNGDAYDDLSQVYYTVIPMTDSAARLVAEITASTAPDVDMFWGFDLNGDGLPQEGEEYDSSATGTAFEYLSEVWFPATFYDVWVLVQNWAGSAAPADDITLSIGVVPYAAIDPATMTVNGPAAIPAGTTFGLDVLWHDIDTQPGDRLYGLFDVYNNAAYDVNVGYTQVDVVREAEDVTKTVDKAAAMPGDTLTYTITVAPNTTLEDLTYTINDVLPAGVTYVDGSVTGGTYDAATNAIQWTGVMTGASARHYVMTTSATDTTCAMPMANSGAYVDLYGHGLNPQAIQGEGTWNWTTSGDPIEFFGQNVGNIIRITDDGFAYMDTFANKPAVNADIPTADAPNNLLAFFWQDLQIVYDAAAIKGVTLANLSTGGIPSAHIVEIDDIQVKGNPAQTYDIEMGITKHVDDTAGEFEVIFAYDNINGPLTTGTIGIENATGTVGVKYAYNDAPLAAITNGSAICFDWVPIIGEPHVITFQVTVDADAPRGLLTNEAMHITDGLGALEEAAGADTMVDETAAVAVDDTYATLKGIALTVAAAGVLVNDTDADSDPLTAVLDIAPAHGTVTLNADGSFTYTPAAGFIGTDTFTYIANDGFLDSDPATVTITVQQPIFLPLIQR